MKRALMLTGDINLMNVSDPQVPFARVKDTLRQADVLFGNLECCFYEPATGHPVEREGFYAPLASARPLVIGGGPPRGRPPQPPPRARATSAVPPRPAAPAPPSPRRGGRPRARTAPPPHPPTRPR